MKIFNIFKNRIIKDTISILFIFLLFFGNIAPLTIKAFSIKNIERVYPYINEPFDFHIPGFIPGFHAEKSPKFQTISQYGILIGIVNVDLDNNELSRIISRGIFLGMNRNEIINEIKNKLKSKIKTIEYEEFFIKKKINAYEYSIDNDKIIINIDSLYIDKNANPGIAVIFEVFNSTILNEGFILKSKCVNDNSENLGKISIDEKNFTLPNSIKLFRNERYRIKYYPNEGYEFDHWEIKNGRLSHRNNESNNILFIQNNYGEIIAHYRKIGVVATTSISTTSLRTTTNASSSSIITTQISTLRTTSIGTTSTKTEIKTTSSILTTSSTKKEENFVDSYIITPIKEYIINPIIKYIIEPINEYIIKPFTKYVIEPILKYIIQPFIEYIIKPIIEIIIKIIEIIKNIIKIILDIFGWIINTITGQSKEISTTSQSFTSYSTKSKTYEITTSIEEKSTYKENLISCEKTKYDSTKFIISYETKINIIYITKTIKTIGNKEIITTYPIITTIYENPYITTITSNTITSYKTSSSSSISTTIPKKTTTIYEKTSTIKNTEEPITTYKQITTTITSSSLTSSTSTSIKTTSTSYKQTTVTSTSSKITSTTTTYSLKTETIFYTITGFTTTYKTPIYTYTTIVTTKKTTTSSSQISGGGGGGREGPLLRDSILSNEEVYNSFLDKIKKIEENENNIKHQYIPSYQILKYLVFKIVPIRINLDNNLEDSKIYKINIVINNYDNIDRNFIIKIEDIKGGTNGFFLNEKIENLDLEKIEGITKDKLDISIKANEIKEIKSQVFFLPPIDLLKECGILNPHSIIYSKKYRISIYTDSKRIFEKEITVCSSSQSKFWKGFYKALSDNWPSLALSTIALILIGVASGGAGIAAKTASMTLFAMFLYSVGMNIMEVYYA
ncbi:MAG: hypothetical protein QW806_09870, partial [Nitrososphaerota archaeon]